MNNAPSAAVSAPRRRRRTKTDAWSASSTVEWIGAGQRSLGRTVDAASAPADAIKAKVHYRYLGASRKPTFSGPTLVKDVAGFQALLAAAHANDWAADRAGRPLAPVALPSLPEDVPAAVPAGHPGARAPLGVPTSASRPTEDAPRDVAWLTKWMKRRHLSKKKKTGDDRSRTTNSGYADALDFFLSLARYDGADSRCLGSGIEAGAHWRVDDPITRVGERDLLFVLEARASTNLRVRRSNQVAMQAWGRAVTAELKHAAAEGRSPNLPELPVMRQEVASARTIEAFARTVREMFADAQAHGLIDYQPWTARVEEEVPYAATTSYIERNLPSRDQVQSVVTSMSKVLLTARTRDGRRDECSGDRYAATVWLAGREGTRPEETIAIRDSWVFLDDGDPRIVLQWAEVYQPRGDDVRVRTRVPLKHRPEGAVRVLRPHPKDAAEFIRILGEHRRSFVATPDPTAGAEDLRDPYFFTNHAGDPIELSNFGRWWRAAISGIPNAERAAVLDNLPFRRLRAAAITDWLVVREMSTNDAAQKGGNSQAVIEKYYKGVLDTRPAATPAAGVAGAGSGTLPEDLGGLSGAELGALADRIRAEEQRRWS